MIPGLGSDALIRLLILALHEVPGHSVTLDQASWDAAAARAAESPGSGFMLQAHDGGITARLADHEDRAVMVDRARASGMTIVESPDVVIGFDTP